MRTLYPEDLRLLADLAEGTVSVSLEPVRGFRRCVVRRAGAILRTVHERVLGRLREAGLVDGQHSLTEQGWQRVVG
jgi:hypothetical protein